MQRPNMYGHHPFSEVNGCRAKYPRTGAQQQFEGKYPFRSSSPLCFPSRATTGGKTIRSQGLTTSLYICIGFPLKYRRLALPGPWIPIYLTDFFILFFVIHTRRQSDPDCTATKISRCVGPPSITRLTRPNCFSKSSTYPDSSLLQGGGHLSRIFPLPDLVEQRGAGSSSSRKRATTTCDTEIEVEMTLSMSL
jgi:hypothetical protein